MRAAIYCRISQDKTGEALGVTRQLEDCTALAEQLGWTVATEHVFSDNDISATSGKPRPEYHRMLAAIEAGEVQAIIAWHPDRVYRRLADLEGLITAVEAKGVAIRTVRAGDFDLATPTGRMIARILASVATGEVEVKADRWKRSVQQRREAGRWSGSGPRAFGWTREGVLIPDEADLIRAAADDVIAGRDLYAIARELNEGGATTTTGRPWSRQTLRQYLENPRVAALATLRGEIVGPGSWDPVLDVETWETVRAVLAVRKLGPRRPRVSVLMGLVFCGRCGGRLTTGGRNDGTRTYRCSREPQGDACGRLSVSAKHVDELVEGFARARFNDPRVRERVAQLQSVEGSSELAADAAMLETRIAELEEQLDEPGVPVTTILRAVARAKTRLEEVRGRLAVAATAQVLVPVDGAPWPEDLERRRRLIGLFVERVIIEPRPTRGGRFDPARVQVIPR